MTTYEQNYEKFQSRFNNYIKELQARSYDKYPDKLKELSELRKIPVEVFEDAGVFFIEHGMELLNPSYLDAVEDFGVISPANNMPIYNGRWVFPIKDMKGNIINHVGYRPDMNERYVYGTAKYYSRLNDLYGMEYFPLAIQEGYAIVTEGITDALAFRGLGYKNSFAWCGVRESKYKNLILNRLPYGIIKVPDNDEAGQRTIKRWDFNRSFLIRTPNGFKDTAKALEYDEWREHYRQCFPLIINELKRTYSDGLVYKDYPVAL